jgi:hypothetical protein
MARYASARDKSGSFPGNRRSAGSICLSQKTIVHLCLMPKLTISTSDEQFDANLCIGSCVFMQCAGGAQFVLGMISHLALACADFGS